MAYSGRVVFLLTFMFYGCSISDNQGDAGLIVSTDWLREAMGDHALVLFHVGTEEVYDSIHIPGSLFLDPYAFTVSSGELRNQLPERDSVMSLLISAGINKDSRIVLYYESERMITRTARVFLTLDYAGFGDQSHVLNGGMDGWFEKGDKKVRGDKEVTGDKKVRGDKEVTILADELDQHRWDPEYALVDVRSAEEYYGEIDSAGQVGFDGHIEGAYFMDYHLLLTEANPQHIKDNNELLLEFEKAGMDRDKTTIFYCGSGVRASLAYLVARHLDYPALIYDGSIEEWEALELPQTSPVIAPGLIKENL